MNKKRILIIEDQNELSGLSPVSDCQLIVTYEPQQALSILMGGGALLKNRYADEKIRPDLLLMHASFFKQESGIELLELIKKYYSLKNVQVFLFGDLMLAPDAATLTKYNVVSFLEPPFSMKDLVELIDESADSNISISKKFWSAPVVFLQDHIRPLLNQIGGHKGAIINSSKAIIKTKMVYGSVSVAAIATAAVGIQLVKNSEHVQSSPKEIVMQAPMPVAAPKAFQVDTFPPVAEVAKAPVLKKELAAAKIEVMEEPLPDTNSVVKFKNDFKIQILPDSTELSSEFNSPGSKE